MQSGERIPQIPVYLKTAHDAPRPEDPEFYWFTRSGLFRCRNHSLGFFKSDVPSRRMPGALAEHQPACRVAFPLLGQAALEYVVGFFDEIYVRHGSEAIVLVLWDMRNKRYRLCVPPQTASVWQSQGGLPCAIDVNYEVPVPLPRDHLLLGDIHSHADLDAYSSAVDTNDERYRDGIHAVVGRIDREPPEFHIELTADNFRFALQFGHFFKGYRARRLTVPQRWLDQVTVKVKRSSWTNNYDYGSSSYGSGTYPKDSGYTYPNNIYPKNISPQQPRKPGHEDH